MNIESYHINTELSETENLLEQYRYAIDVGTIVSKTDKYGRITYVNDEFCRVSQYNRDELIGAPHNIVRHADMPQEAFADLWQTIRDNRSPWQGTIKNRKKDGSPYWVNTTVVPILDQSDEVIEYIAIRSDITAQMQIQQHLRELLEASKKFVPEKFLQILDIADITKLSEKATKKMQLSILFADIRSFTSITENMAPTDVFHELNEFLSYMEPAISSHRGVIDKYIGDAIMAIFTEPAEAVSAGRGMLKQLDEYNALRSGADRAPLKIGIGIHTGVVSVGTVGTDIRKSTTVLGDTVNLASRIEQLTKKVEHPLLFSEETAEHMPDKKLKRVGRVRVRGRENPVRIYTLGA